ncbi:hypothetical protein Tco_0044984 [Tanacetum coccineum]
MLLPLCWNEICGIEKSATIWPKEPSHCIPSTTSAPSMGRTKNGQRKHNPAAFRFCNASGDKRVTGRVVVGFAGVVNSGVWVVVFGTARGGVWLVDGVDDEVKRLVMLYLGRNRGSLFLSSINLARPIAWVDGPKRVSSARVNASQVFGWADLCRVVVVVSVVGVIVVGVIVIGVVTVVVCIGGDEGVCLFKMNCQLLHNYVLIFKESCGVVSTGGDEVV